jgi:hypothetical protein
MRQLDREVAEDGGARWSFNGDGAPVAGVGTHGCVERRVSGRGRLTEKELGGGAHHGLAVGGDSSSKKGDDDVFRTAMLGHEDKGRLWASHELFSGEGICVAEKGEWQW